MRKYQHFIFVMFSEPEKRYHRNPSLARRGTPSFYWISLRICSIFSIIQMYCYKQICVKYLEVIHTSIIKQKSELFRYIRAEYK